MNSPDPECCTSSDSVALDNVDVPLPNSNDWSPMYKEQMLWVVDEMIPMSLESRPSHIEILVNLYSMLVATSPAPVNSSNLTCAFNNLAFGDLGSIPRWAIFGEATSKMNTFRCRSYYSLLWRTALDRFLNVRGSLWLLIGELVQRLQSYSGTLFTWLYQKSINGFTISCLTLYDALLLLADVMNVFEAMISNELYLIGLFCRRVQFSPNDLSLVGPVKHEIESRLDVYIRRMETVVLYNLENLCQKYYF